MSTTVILSQNTIITKVIFKIPVLKHVLSELGKKKTALKYLDIIHGA